MSALTSLLARDQVVAVRKIEEALQKLVVQGGDIASVLLELDALPENTLAAYSAALVGRLPATRDEVMRAPRDVVRVVPREVAEKHRLVPIAVDTLATGAAGPTLLIALATPLSPDVEHQLSFLLGHTLVSRVVCEVRVAAALSHHYGLEPSPRMRRLIERLRERDAGSVPYVAPPESAKLPSHALAGLTKKSSAATSFLDESDEADEPLPAPEPVRSILRPSGLPPSEGRTTDPIGIPRHPSTAPRSIPPDERTDPGHAPPGDGGDAGHGDGPGDLDDRTDDRAGDRANDRAGDRPDDRTVVESSFVPASVKTNPPPRRVSVPPPASVRPQPAPAASQPSRSAPWQSAPSPPEERGALVPPRPTTRPELKAAVESSARSLKKLRGPLSASQAVQLLEAAQGRDDVLEVLFAFARQFFDYSAAFTVHEDVAEARESYGAGVGGEELKRVRVVLGPIAAPRGVLAEARARVSPLVAPLDRNEIDRGLAKDLDQSPSSVAVVVPVAIRNRVVLLVLGIRANEVFTVSDVPELVGFVPRVVDALERVILRKKRSFSSSERSAPLKAAAQDARRSAAPQPRSRSYDRWGAVEADPPARATPPEADQDRGTVPGIGAPQIAAQSTAPQSTAPRSTGASGTGASGTGASGTGASGTGASGIAEGAPRRSREGSLADAILAQAGEEPAALPAHVEVRVSEPPPRTLLGIPRSAPPPPDDIAHLLPVVSLPPRDALSRTTARLGPAASASSPAPVPSSSPEDDEPELSVGPDSDSDEGGEDGEDDDSDEPELSVSEGTDDDGTWEPEEEEEGEVFEGRTTQPSPAPFPPPPDLSSVPPAVLIAPVSVPAEASGYSMHDLDEEVVIPLKRRARSSAPPAASLEAASSTAGEPSRSDPRRSDPRRDDPRRESNEVPSSDRISVSAIERVGAVERNVEKPAPSSAPPERSSREVPSVIVDMGDAVDNLVVDLQHAGPDDERAAVNALLRLGEAALPVLAQTFPGPLWFDRNRPHRRTPRGRDTCAIARAFYAFGVRATPYVATLTSSSHPDKRYYALLLAGDMVHPSLLDAVVARIFDDDDAIRKLSHEIVPRFRGLAGWDEQLTVIRRAARIRGKDPRRRVHALTALSAVRDVGALRMLVELLEDDDRDVVRYAHLALVTLTAEDLGASPRKWAMWVDKNDARHRIEWLIDALVHADEALRTTAGEELKQLTQQYFGFHPGTTRREREVAQGKYRQWWMTEGKKQFG